MANRSFNKASSLQGSLRPHRPSIARTSSNSSTKSQECPSPLSSSFTTAGESESRPKSSGGSSISDKQQRIARSRPIAIELPPRRRSGQVYTPTPPEPLSARGDLLGGYFPLHEESQRSYKPHPFTNESSSTKGGVVNSIMPATRSPQYSPMGHILTEQPHLVDPRSIPAADALLMSIPLGKYHPSNYKNNVKIPEKHVAQAQTASSQPKHHSRKKSDIKKKLQQYQRDMVEQAAIAGRMHIPGMKPTSPRLLPLNSPGPVTPMELEESMSYLSVGTKTGYPGVITEDMITQTGIPKERRNTLD